MATPKLPEVKVTPKLHEVLAVATAVCTFAAWLVGQISAMDALSVGSVLTLIAGGLSRLHILP